ncbi:MAG: hypothetical protein Q8Q32_00205 [bacterium]|nr:hypothetical protein [bacterium]
MRGVLIKFAVCLTFAGSLLVPVFVNAEGRTVFEVPDINSESGYWGGFRLSDRKKIAIKYRPQFTHSICEMQHRISATAGPTDELILRIYKGPGIESGELIEEIITPASELPSHTQIYSSFPLSECVVASPGEEYNFVFSKSNPNSGLYSSALRYTGSPKAPSKIQETDYFQFYQGGWHEDTSKDFSLLLKGYREPVVIIPGILGTRINNADTGEEIWPKQIEVFGGDEGLNTLILENDGKADTTPVNLGEIILTERGDDFYKPLIDQFSKYEESKDLILYPYDWRKDLNSEATLLATKIEQAASSSITGRVNIVAHSMGGLLAKEYLRQNGDEQINQIVLMGSPKLGSPKAFKALNWGDDMNISKLGLGLNAERMKIIGQNMPAVYQLLPSREYLAREGHGYVQDRRDSSNLKVLDFEAIKDFMLENPEDSRNEALINLADDFHTALDSFNFPEEKTHNIIACQHPTTIGGFLLYPKGKVEVYFVDGDGTVPTLSGNYQSVAGQSYYALNNDLAVDHTGLVKNSETTALARKIIEGEEINLEDGISSSFEECSKGELSKNKVISTHSPVIPHFYDSNDNHTGPDENGDIELGIPGSDYFIIGKNHFGIIPDGVSFRVEIEGTGTGSFDFKIKSYTGTEIEEIKVFLEVPIENINLKASYDPDTEKLTLDKTGDGETEDDIELSPSSVLSDESAQDTDPPTISIQGVEEKEYVIDENNDNLLHILVTSEDSGSGLISESQSLNGELFDDIVINTSEIGTGEHVFAVEAYDKAGNLALKEIHFTVVEDPEQSNDSGESASDGTNPTDESETDENQEEEPPVENEENEEEQQEQEETEEENSNSETNSENDDSGGSVIVGSGSAAASGQVLGVSTINEELRMQLLMQLLDLLKQLLALLQAQVL